MSMLSSNLMPWLIGIGVVLLLISGFTAQFMFKLAAYCYEAVEEVQNNNKRSVTLRKMAEVEATLTELTDSYEAILTSHKKLRSRIGMRAAREKKSNGLDSDADKDALRLDAKQRGLI